MATTTQPRTQPPAGSRRRTGRASAAPDGSAAAGAQKAPAGQGTPFAPDENGRQRGRKGSAGRQVLTYLAVQVGRMQDAEALVRADDPDGVRQLRAAARRIRSTLSTFGPLFDAAVSEPLRSRLHELDRRLGAARDPEVIREQVLALLAAEPDDLVMGPVQARVVTSLSARAAEAARTLRAELDGTEYAQLRADLHRLVADPPLTETARAAADRVLPPLVARSWQRLSRRHDRAEAVAAGEPGSAQAVPGRAVPDAHDVRTAAKRARYAGEVLIPRYGSPAVKWVARMRALQDVLGARQDSAVVRAELRRLAVQAQLDGENAFSYGRLHALEQARADATEDAYRRAWRRAARRKRHRWLKA